MGVSEFIQIDKRTMQQIKTQKNIEFKTVTDLEGFKLKSELMGMTTYHKNHILIAETKDTMTVVSDRKIWLNEEVFENTSFTHVNLSNTYTDKLEHLFKNNVIRHIDLGNIQVSDLSNLRGAFSSSFLVRDINLGELDISKATDMANMFSYCKAIKTIKINGSNNILNTVESMFSGCKNLIKVDLGDIDIPYGCSTISMFRGCRALKEIKAPQTSSDAFLDGIGTLIEVQDCTLICKDKILDLV